MIPINKIILCIFVAVLIFITHEAGHVVYEGLDTSEGYYGFEFTGIHITEPGFYVYVLADKTPYGDAAGFVLSLVFVIASRYATKLSSTVFMFMMLYTIWLARWDFLRMTTY